jgi:hypothetical protein
MTESYSFDTFILYHSHCHIYSHCHMHEEYDKYKMYYSLSYIVIVMCIYVHRQLIYSVFFCDPSLSHLYILTACMHFMSHSFNFIVNAIYFDVILCQHIDILGNKFNLFFRNCINILVFVDKDIFFLHISINIYFIYSYI